MTVEYLTSVNPMTVRKQGVSNFNFHFLIVTTKTVATVILVCLLLYVLTRTESAELVNYEDCVRSVRVGDRFYRPDTILNLTDKLVGLTFDDQDNLVFLTRSNESSATKLSVLNQNRLQPSVVIDEIPKQIRKIKTDHLTGRIYLATDTGLFNYDQNDAQNKLKLYAFEGIDIQNLLVQSNGTVYIADDERNFMKIDKNGEKNYSSLVSKSTQLAVNKAGKVYRVKDMFTFEILQEGEKAFKHEDIHDVNDIAFDDESNTYIVTLFGFDYLSKNDGLHYKVMGVSPNAVSIALDSKNNIVLGYSSKAIKYTRLAECRWM